MNEGKISNYKVVLLTPFRFIEVEVLSGLIAISPPD